MLDTVDTPGLIVLNGPSRLVGGEPHFHIYVPLEQVSLATLPGNERLPQEALGPLFETALEEAWSTLALQGRANQSWVWPAENHLPFLRASIRFWPSFDEAPRYSNGINVGERLGQLNLMVHYVLVNLGVPQEALLATEIDSAETLRELAISHGIEV
ncbi:hypothetical protein [Haliangium sp.]|uniref:hypothetical protein n=1 Tax=Haliangium sp. TaxID=2663208 RepID=UPI003D1315DB